MGKTMLDKIWDAHEVAPGLPGGVQHAAVQQNSLPHTETARPGLSPPTTEAASSYPDGGNERGKQ